MLKFYELNEEKRIIITADTGRLVEQEDGTVIMVGERFDFPEDFDFNKQLDYKIIDGELVYDPIAQPEQKETTEDVLNALLGVTE